MATLVRWDPLREVTTLHNEMSRFMNGLLEGNGRTTQAWVPALDVWETDDALVYAFDLPGVSEDTIAIEFQEGTLTVSAERARSEEVKSERFYRAERRYGTFSRAVGLPQGVTEDSISASMKNGVLEVHVRKPEEPKPRRIQIGGTEERPTIEGSPVEPTA